VFAIPLWNYTIPYKLKQLVDVDSQNGLIFDLRSSRGWLGHREARR